MTLNEKTRIRFGILEWIALVAFVFSVGTGFTVVGVEANTAKEQSAENKNEIKELREKHITEREQLINLIRDVRESQIRIEGELKLKQDRRYNE